MSGRARDPVHGHIFLEVETYEDGGKTKSRQKSTCVHCGKMQVFANVGRLRANLSGDDSIAAKDGGGWGACAAVPVLVKQKLKAPPYHGIVIEIEFKKKKDGAYQKGYYVKTARVGDTDATSTGTRIYAIKEALMGLIPPKDNPRYVFRQSRASDSRKARSSGSGRAVAATPPRYREMPRI
ncbi:hypothetical protein M885DRAFT_569989 [Pelagophyceae sp. CCMP2097]|nr:hypothetical protein M885DRAFT_569989 [Pelagophyceae sp. CCMP2097]